MTPLLSVLPLQKKNKSVLESRKLGFVQMSQLVCGVSIWRMRVPPERQVVRARTAWTTPYGKHPWKQKQTRAGWKAHWPVGHSPELGSCWVSAQARGLLLCPLGQRSPGDRCSRKQLCERAGGGCEPGFRCAPPTCYFGPGYVVTWQGGR